MEPLSILMLCLFLLSFTFYLFNFALAITCFGCRETDMLHHSVCVLGFLSACFIGINGILTGIRDDNLFLFAAAVGIVSFNVSFNFFMYSKYKAGIIALMVAIVGAIVSYF